MNQRESKRESNRERKKAMLRISETIAAYREPKEMARTLGQFHGSPVSSESCRDIIGTPFNAALKHKCTAGANLCARQF
jgi:hypothetical protein